VGRGNGCGGKSHHEFLERKPAEAKRSRGDAAKLLKTKNTPLQSIVVILLSFQSVKTGVLPFEKPEQNFKTLSPKNFTQLYWIDKC
jgi:hypothetical protein